MGEEKRMMVSRRWRDMIIKVLPEAEAGAAGIDPNEIVVKLIFDGEGRGTG